MKVFWSILLLPVTLLFMVGFVGVLILWWIAGVPLAIRRNKTVIGHIRWFKYTKI